MPPLNGNLWAATAGEVPPADAAGSADEADTVVVGVGVTGLSAALHLSERGQRVTLIEGGDLAGGATGRSSGQVLPGLKAPPSAFEGRLSAAAASRLAAWSGGGPDLVFDLVARWNIDCAAVRAGAVQAAATARGMRTLCRWAQEWRDLGAPVRVIDRDEAVALLGTPAYRGGIVDARGGSIHPLNYALGLARAANALGASLCLRTSARALHRSRDGWRVETDGGDVRCASVVVATNAYSGSLVPGLHRSVVALRASQVASRPLPEDMRTAILPQRHVASDRRRALISFRISPCGRLIVGGPGGTRGLRGPALQRAARRTGQALFGHLGTLDWEYGWSGHVAITRDSQPHLHEPERGLHVALGYNGEGLALGTALGKLVAERVCGRSAESMDVAITPIRRIPLHGVVGKAIALGERILPMVDRIEQRLT